MVKIIFLLKYFFITAAIPLLLILNLFVWRSLSLGIICTTIYLLFYGRTAGLVLFPKEPKLFQKTVGLLILLTGISSVGAIVYYFYELNDLVIALLIVIAPLMLLKPILQEKSLLKFKNYSRSLDISQWRLVISWTNILVYLLTFTYLIFAAFAFYTLWKFQSDAALRSPWWVVPDYFFVIYFIASFILLTILLKQRHIGKGLILTIIHSALSLSVALVIYKLGYGFDPIIHQATEKQIWQSGAVSPKPLYYLGQYSLVVILSKLTRLSVISLDKFLVITMASVYLPITIFFAFRRIIHAKLSALPLSLLWLLIPFGVFIVTTPQALANVLTLVTIFLALVYAHNPSRKQLLGLSILVLASLTAHPISGIPIAIFYVLLFIAVNYQAHKKLSALVLAEIAIIASLIMPAIFILNSWLNKNLQLTINYEFLKKPWEVLINLNPSVYFKNNFNLILDIVYWYGNNIKWIMLALGLTGVVLAIRLKRYKIANIYFLTFIVLIVNYFLLTTFVSFDYLIEYERFNFQIRLLEIAFYFLWPLIFYALYALLAKTMQGAMAQKLAVITLLSLFMTGSLYLSYPRDDEYHLDRGYNITQSDVLAARYINEDGRGQRYIVLANQMNSAAALREFGFKQYYRDVNNPQREYFYYPIPTGDPLYQFYLDMVYERPDKKTAVQAMDIVGVDAAYLVVNKYWDKFDEIVENAKLESDSWQNLNNGQIYIFKYTR
ncbi:MAG: hypothetical protein COT81_00840 [Candidatus Buchananbacteria bacterium CG10_big_fil_rev_8_21_14_0_10_42_9]|uniref:Glycosyltransferase RgtA/B/C/D-like domain-containing protein n=1 Tax=Candidatus Buchananbacteria bacterium CG10_big_fil_rev_8_21_14_0_10_42_9 TaxID=1974526 RepID=A0A2H0W2E1_9BACT|nr:MAG: hypothetical protein COT81_00840 [Candidatus Buchananbacteria bacterium CG10_big_fil_rev_8_21_14_0_10_42_9]